MYIQTLSQIYIAFIPNQASYWSIALMLNEYITKLFIDWLIHCIPSDTIMRSPTWPSFSFAFSNLVAINIYFNTLSG